MTLYNAVEEPAFHQGEAGWPRGRRRLQRQPSPTAALFATRSTTMSNDPSSNAAPLHGKRILVVEDEFLIQLDIQNILEGAGAQSIVAASRVSDALEAVEASAKSDRRFDAAVLDLRLEKESAVPVAERLAILGVPFVFLTGAPTDGALARKFESAPVAGKPFDSATLLAALQQALSGRR